MVMAACGSRGKLARNIEGSWSSVPERIEIAGFYSTQLTKTFEFMPRSDNGGDVVVSAAISSSKAMPSSDSIIAPVSVNAAASAYVTGTYSVSAHNRIHLALEPSTFRLTVDPDAVDFDYNALTTEEKPDLEALAPQWLKELTAKLTPAVEASMMGTASISDIKMTGNMMHCHMGAIDVTLRRLTLPD